MPTKAVRTRSLRGGMLEILRTAYDVGCVGCVTGCIVVEGRGTEDDKIGAEVAQRV